MRRVRAEVGGGSGMLTRAPGRAVSVGPGRVVRYPGKRASRQSLVLNFSAVEAVRKPA